MFMTALENVCTIVTAGRAACTRLVLFRGVTATEAYQGEIEIAAAPDGSIQVFVDRIRMGGRMIKWRNTRVVVELSREAWEHLRSVQLPDVHEGEG